METLTISVKVLPALKGCNRPVSAGCQRPLWGNPYSGSGGKDSDRASGLDAIAAFLAACRRELLAWRSLLQWGRQRQPSIQWSQGPAGVAIEDVGIDLGRGDIPVLEQLLGVLSDANRRRVFACLLTEAAK